MNAKYLFSIVLYLYTLFSSSVEKSFNKFLKFVSNVYVAYMHHHTNIFELCTWINPDNKISIVHAIQSTREITKYKILKDIPDDITHRMQFFFAFYNNDIDTLRLYCRACDIDYKIPIHIFFRVNDNIGVCYVMVNLYNMTIRTHQHKTNDIKMHYTDPVISLAQLTGMFGSRME